MKYQSEGNTFELLFNKVNFLAPVRNVRSSMLAPSQQFLPLFLEKDARFSVSSALRLA